MSKLRPGEAKKLAQCDTALFDSHVAISVMSSNAWLPGITHPPVLCFVADIHKEGVGNT